MNERYIDICNWGKFQHKDIWRKSGGKPPWIKTYTALLSKDEWVSLSQSQQGILVNLWLMYASAGQSVGEAGAKRRLCRSDAEARWWRSNLDALNRAGFIEFLSQPSRAPVAPRVEKSREESSNTLLEQPQTRAKGHGNRGNGWVENLSSYTGCRYVRGEFALTAIYDPLGTERPPADWPHERPSREEIREALKEHSVA